MINLRILRSPDGDVGGGTAPEMASESTPNSQSGDSNSAQPSGDGQESTEGSTAEPVESAKSDGDRLRELISKAKDKNYRLTSDEMDLMERYDSGKLTLEESTDEDKVNENEKPEVKSTALEEALKEVGAKTPEELTTKIKELKKFIGSRDVQAYKQLETTHQELSKKAQNHQQWLSDLQAGKEEAIQYLKNIMGEKFNTFSNSIPKPNNEGQYFDSDDFLNPEVGHKVNNVIDNLMKEVATLKNQLNDTALTSKEASEYYRAQSHEAQRNATRNEIKSELANLAAEPMFREYFQPKSGTVQNLLEDYWKGNEGDPVDPRVEPILEIFNLAKTFGMDDYKSAFKLAAKQIAFEKMQNKLLTAEQKGIQKIQQAKKSITPASTGSKSAETNYSIEDVKSMASGKQRIPDSWMDRFGDIDINKVPVGLRPHLV